MMRFQRTILIVDDDPDVCLNMADILTDRGYAVATAYEGHTALQLVNRQPYDLALLDLKMPGMDGLTLCREVMRVRPATVALLITGYPEDVQPTEAQAAGVRQILRKPVDVPRLLGNIEKAFAC
jgi:CheY-like chemotaxis protein